MTHARRLLAAASITGLLAAASCTGSDEQESPDDDQPPPVDTAAWQPCPEVPEEVVGHLVQPQVVDQLTTGLTYECATIDVPQDWNSPDGDTFEVALLRVRHDDQSDRIGSLVINPGGPGGSGVDMAVYLSFDQQFGGLPRQVLERFDLVGFDPRGVKRSSPVDCFSDEELDATFAAEPDPVSDEEFAEQLDESERMAQSCAQEYGDTLGLFSTHQTAQDLDAIREAVGDDQLTYLGFSYGTLLGAVYAHLFPDNIRAMVLDGAVDPGRDRVTRARTQAEGFERAFTNFTQWCADADESTCPLGDDAREAVTGALDDARESPAVGDDGRAAEPGWVFTAVISALYSEQTWQLLAAAIDQLQGGDPTGIFDLADSYAERSADGEYSNLFDANSAVSCADDDSTVTEEQVRDLQEQWRDELPLFGGPMAAGLMGCETWPADPDPYPVGAADGAPPLLVVGTTGDPATPYESTQRLAETLDVGVVLTFEGEGHTAYPEDECVAAVVDDYLINLTVPDDGTTC